MWKWISVALFLLPVLGAGCQSSQSAGQPGQVVAVGAGSYRNIAPEDLNNMLKAKDFLLIDVHTPNQGHLAQTDLRIPYDQIEANAGKLPADKDAAIVLYCRSGAMSKIASEKLVELGYRNLMNLKGGVAAWQDAGFAVEPN